MDSTCPTKHPNSVAFVHALCGEADCVIQRMDNVAKGREQPPCYNELVYPELTPAFLAMIEEDKKANMIADQPKLTNKRSGQKKHGSGVK